MIGKLIKPIEPEYFSAKILPNFCTGHRWQEIDVDDYCLDLVIEELILTHNLTVNRVGQQKQPLLCRLHIPFMYDMENDYADSKSMEYDRFCIEELEFEFLNFDHGLWCDLSKLCTVLEAETIISKLRNKIDMLKFTEDTKEYFFENRLVRDEQKRCPICENICLIDDVYCRECGELVGEPLLDCSAPLKGMFPN